MNQKPKDLIVFYVSPKGDNLWSGLRANPSQRRTDGPFATIEKARTVIRELKTKGKFNLPITVFIRTGFYQLTEPLIFTPEDSGTKEFPITYTAYPGEAPVISGGKKIKFKKEKTGNLWLTEIPEVKKGKWYFRQLFVNGTRRYRSRLPQKGFYRIVEVPGVDFTADLAEEKPCQEFRFADKEIKSTWTNLNDVEVVILH